MITGYTLRHYLDGTITASRHESWGCWPFIKKTSEFLGQFKNEDLARKAIREDAIKNQPKKVHRSRWFNSNGDEDLSW